MTAAGVQTNDSAAYLPPPPSTSMPDAKGTSAAGSQVTDPQAADAQGSPSDFQSELALQESDAQQADPKRTESKGSPKADTGKSVKKRNVRPEDANLAPVMPVQVAEPQKQILPLALSLPQLQENATQDDESQAGGCADQADLPASAHRRDLGRSSLSSRPRGVVAAEDPLADERPEVDGLVPPVGEPVAGEADECLLPASLRHPSRAGVQSHACSPATPADRW